MKIRLQAFALILIVPMLAAGCGRVRARSAFKDGNKAYKEENFKQAVKDYQHAVDLDPTMAEAMFYLGSSHQAQFRPGKETPENKAHLDEAICAQLRRVAITLYPAPTAIP
jgi:tetratricopeptide (TPR) repeat protein